MLHSRSSRGKVDEMISELKENRKTGITKIDEDFKLLEMVKQLKAARESAGKIRKGS